MKYVFLCLLCFFTVFCAYTRDLAVKSSINEDGYVEAANVKGAVNQRIYCKNHTLSKISITVDGVRSKTDVVPVVKSKKLLDVNKGSYLSSNFDNHLEVFQNFIIKCREGKIVDCKVSAAHGDLYIDVYKIQSSDSIDELPESDLTENIQKKSEVSDKGTKIKTGKRKSESAPEPEKSESSEPVVDQLLKWKQLLDMGAITQEEYDTQKAKLLNN